MYEAKFVNMDTEPKELDKEEEGLRVIKQR